MVIRARSARKSSSQASAPPRTAAADAPIATWKLFCQAWSLTRGTAEQVDVVGPVQVGLRRGRTVGDDLAPELVEDAGVDPVGVVVGAWQERRQRRQQNRRPYPRRAVGPQVPGHLTGTGAEPDQHRPAQVERVEQGGEVGGERVVVVADAGPAGGAEAAPVVGDDPVPGGQQRGFLLLPGAPIEQVPVHQHHGRALPVVLVVDRNGSGVLPAHNQLHPVTVRCWTRRRASVS